MRYLGFSCAPVFPGGERCKSYVFIVISGIYILYLHVAIEESHNGTNGHDIYVMLVMF